MKKIFAIVLATLMLLAFAACGAKGAAGNGTVTSAGHISIDGICVDDSYADDDNEALRMVYLFYTVNGNDENVIVDSTRTEVTINGANSYKSNNLFQINAFAENYYYSTTQKEVSMGASLKVVETFVIPEAELATGRTIALKNDWIKGTKKIKLSTDDIKHFNSDEEVAKAMDPDGYASVLEKRKPADAETVKKVSSNLNGYYWTFYYGKVDIINHTDNSMTGKIEFSDPNNFVKSDSLGFSASGTYEVLKGFVACTYQSNGLIVYIPWNFDENDGLNLDCDTAFEYESLLL